MKIEMEEQHYKSLVRINIEIDETAEHQVIGEDRTHLYAACYELLEDVKQAARSAYSQTGQPDDRH